MTTASPVPAPLAGRVEALEAQARRPGSEGYVDPAGPVRALRTSRDSRTRSLSLVDR